MASVWPGHRRAGGGSNPAVIGTSAAQNAFTAADIIRYTSRFA